jgi:hypothetical protein
VRSQRVQSPDWKAASTEEGDLEDYSPRTAVVVLKMIGIVRISYNVASPSTGASMSNQIQYFLSKHPPPHPGWIFQLKSKSREHFISGKFWKSLFFQISVFQPLALCFVIITSKLKT